MINKIIDFQNLIFKLQKFWYKKGCFISQSFDMKIGAGTFHPITFFSTLKKKSFMIAYVQKCRRPLDGRYGKSFNRLQDYYQFQVIIKPYLINLKNIYLESLKFIGINNNKNDIRFVEDNWKNPTLGAYGYGWEVQLNGLEITQFTHFQKMGGIDCNITSEITYGLERIAMHIQKVSNIYKLILSNKLNKIIKYNFFLRNEIDQSLYNFKILNINIIINNFKKCKEEIKNLLNNKKILIFPIYEKILELSHFLNLLNSRNIISKIEKKRYIFCIYFLIKKFTKIYYKKYIKK